MSPKKCNHNKNLIKLYSSTNFVPLISDTKPLGKWDIFDEKIKFNCNFISKYSSNHEFFKAVVTFDVVNVNSVLTNKNITVKDIYFKSEFNVSTSSQTNDYHYLYEISSSSADNSDSESNSSSSASITSIINKRVEKELCVAIKAFFASPGNVTVTFVDGIASLTLTANENFPSAKLIAKYKFVSDSSSKSSSESFSSSSSSSSSSSKTSVGKKIIKTLIIASVSLFALVLLIKLYKTHNCTGYDNIFKNAEQLKNKAGDFTNEIIKKSKALLGLNQPVYYPVVEPIVVDPIVVDPTVIDPTVDLTVVDPTDN